MEKAILGGVVSLLALFILLYLIDIVAEVTEPKQNTVFHNMWNDLIQNTNLLFILILSIPTGGLIVLIYFLKSQI